MILVINITPLSEVIIIKYVILARFTIFSIIMVQNQISDEYSLIQRLECDKTC